MIGVAGQLGDVDDLGARELVLELGDAAFIEGLRFLGGVILGVLREVAMRARLGDRRDDPRTLDLLAVLQLLLESRVAAGASSELVHLSSVSNTQSDAPRPVPDRPPATVVRC